MTRTTTGNSPKEKQDQRPAEFLRPQQAADYFGISRRKLYDLAEIDPAFPRKITLSSRCVGWRRASLDAYLAEKEGAA